MILNYWVVVVTCWQLICKDHIFQFSFDVSVGTSMIICNFMRNNCWRCDTDPSWLSALPAWKFDVIHVVGFSPNPQFITTVCSKVTAPRIWMFAKLAAFINSSLR